MIKKCLSFTLIYFLLATFNLPIISAQTKTDNAASDAAKIKAKVEKRGTGEKKRVSVKMLDGTKLKGYVSQTAEDSFTIVDSKTKQPVTIAYRDVEKVKNRMTKGDKIAIAIIGGAAATAAVILLSIIAIRCRNEGGC